MQVISPGEWCQTCSDRKACVRVKVPFHHQSELMCSIRDTRQIWGRLVIDHDDHQINYYFFLLSLIFLYMPLERQAGSNQHRGNLGNCLTMSSRPLQTGIIFCACRWSLKKHLFSTHLLCCHCSASESHG